jgi:transposase-like protein
MANLQAIAALHRSGHSNRQIARVLGVNRETVGKFVSELQNQPNPQTGSGDHAVSASPQVKAGPLSSCEPFRDQIILGIEAGLSIKRIHQDIVREHGYAGTYHCVWRMVSKIEHTSPMPFRRMEVEPGGDVPSAGAILDRFLSNAEVIEITGESYRMRGPKADSSSSVPSKKSKTGQTRKPGTSADSSEETT